MRKLSFFTAVVSFFLLALSSIGWAQTISSQKGLTTAIFSTEFGKIKMYLPDDIRPGDLISGTVVTEPNGNSAKQIKKNLAELSNYTFSIDGSKYSIDDRQGWSWQLKQDRKMTATIELINRSGVATALLPLQLKEPVKQALSTGCIIPSHALTGSPMRISGSFDGDAANTKVSINNQQAAVLAESPRGCFVTFPITATGTQTIRINESKKESCEKNISAIDLQVSVPKTNLLRGEKTTLTVAVSGLQNLTDTAVLTLRNNTTGTVLLNPSNKIVIALEPDSVKSGTYSRQFEVQSISTGNFIININLELPEPGNNNQYGFFCDDKCSPVGKETDVSVGEVGISSSVTSNPDAEDKAFKTAKWLLENGDLFGATGNEEAALQALEKIGRTRGYVIWVKPCWKRCEEGFFCNDWKRYCGDWMPVIWVDGLENSGDNTFTATGGHTASGEGKVEGKTRKELLDLAVKVGNGLIKKK